ncbi:MAG: hypothetical protein AB1345_09270 [Chloroflexota bacterium]
MGRKKFDGVVEAVRYSPNGEIKWVRAYERRGPTFSDSLLLDRKTLMERLKDGQRYVTGRRLAYMASTFETGDTLRVLKENGREVVVVGDRATDRDWLAEVPIF